MKVELGREGVILVGVGDSRLPSSESKFLRRVAVHAVAAMSNALLERKLDSALQQLGEIEKIRALGLLAAGVAHDFNNLLTVILSSGQRLAADSNRGTAELGVFICEAGQRRGGNGSAHTAVHGDERGEPTGLRKRASAFAAMSRNDATALVDLRRFQRRKSNCRD